ARRHRAGGRDHGPAQRRQPPGGNDDPGDRFGRGSPRQARRQHRSRRNQRQGEVLMPDHAAALPEAPLKAPGQRPEAPLKAPGQRPEAPLKAPGQRPEAPLKAPGQRPEAPLKAPAQNKAGRQRFAVRLVAGMLLVSLPIMSAIAVLLTARSSASLTASSE